MKEIGPPKKRIIDSEHIHVYNGGYGFSLVQYDASREKDFSEWITMLEVEEGYFGYSEGKISINAEIKPETLEKIGKFFFRAADRLRETGLCRKGE